MWAHWRLNWFFLPILFFVIYLKFWQQNILKNHYLSHLCSGNCEVNLLNLTCWGLANNAKNALKFQYGFQFQFFFSFHWENGSMINSFHIVAPNSLIPSRCTLTHWELSERYQECGMKRHALRDLLCDKQNKTKQNKLPYFIDRCETQKN
jgi:hypothetical protein